MCMHKVVYLLGMLSPPGCGEIILRSHSIHLLGAWLDRILSFKVHITNKCKLAILNVQQIKSTHRYFTVDTCKILIHSLLVSHLDYAHSLLYWVPDREIKKMQTVQNLSAKLTLWRSKYDSSSQCLIDLCWLPLQQIIEFKILTLVYSSLDHHAALYLQELLRRKEARRQGLCSQSGNKVLEVSVTKRKPFTDRTFSVAGPKLWNT